MLFASLALEREPLQWAQLPAALLLEAQNAGGVATLGLAAWLLSRLLQREPVLMLSPAMPEDRRALLTNLFVWGTLVAVAGYGLIVFLWIANLLGFTGVSRWFPRTGLDQPITLGDYSLMIGGVAALSVVCAPILYSFCCSLRVGRVWAIARLSWKEAVRGRVVWVYGAMALVFLFADWFVTYKPEDQVRNYVRVVYWSITPLFLLTAASLGAFSIPNDVANNSIHTIVTKPVEKFEIVLGRFLGYGVILSVGLLIVSCLSLVYVVRGINEEAKQESYKARDVVYGQLHFTNTKEARRAESVGREWGYRSYIQGPTRMHPEPMRQFAIWDFMDVPRDLGQREGPVRFEFAFDVFRLSKGPAKEEGRGIFCTFTFAAGTTEPEEVRRKANQMREERNQKEAELRKKYERGQDNKEAEKHAREALKQDLLQKYGIYQVVASVVDYHTQDIDVPSGVFVVLLKNRDSRPDAETPVLRVFVHVNPASESQMVGVARGDFYLMAYERPFWQNFLKGIFGLWCTHMLVLGVAIAFSTYLSSVIALLATFFLYAAGLCTDYLKEIAERQLDGGGPTESIIRVVNVMPLAAKLDPSPTASLVRVLDDSFSWVIARLINVIPDLNRFDLHQYVANGFDIAWVNMLFLDNLVPLAGYLLPWLVAAYYMMKYREIANP